MKWKLVLISVVIVCCIARASQTNKQMTNIIHHTQAFYAHSIHNLSANNLIKNLHFFHWNSRWECDFFFGCCCWFSINPYWLMRPQAQYNMHCKRGAVLSIVCAIFLVITHIDWDMHWFRKGKTYLISWQKW